MPRKKIENREGKETRKIAVKRKSPLETILYDTSGKEVKTVELPKEIFNVKVSDKLLAQYIRVYLANQRQGTHSTKTRSEVTGSTRKIYRQKGTGRARHGDIKAPIFIGGGIAHGPKPQDFSLKMNKQQKRKALLGSLSLRFRQGDIVFVDGFSKIRPKTKTLMTVFEHLKVDPQNTTLFIYRKNNSENLVLASRNVPNAYLCEVRSINAYNVLRPKKIIFAKEALEEVVHYANK